jgi:two-component system, OmpR family, phosphate regulon sensor histidine kinase PhoR
MIVTFIVGFVVAVVLAAGWWRSCLELGRVQMRADRQQTDLNEARRSSDRLIHSLAEAAEGFIVFDSIGHIVTANAAAMALVQSPNSDCQGSRLEDIVKWPVLSEALLECQSSGTARSFDIEAVEMGVPIHLGVSVRAIPELGAVVVLRDLRRIKQLESMRQEFVANVSHELKTPLAAIQGFIETVQDDEEMPAAIRMRFLTRVAQQTERLATLVSDLLALTRLDDDLEILNADPCDVVAVINDSLRDLAQIAEQRGIEMECDLPDQPVMLRAEAEALRLIISNLVNNALNYTAERGLVSIKLQEQPGKIRLEVSDTGIGLREEDQERIFERFYRVDQARSRDLGGTGLGLSIVKNTAKSLNGEIGVRSEVGVGSMFWVELPCDAVPVG